MDRVALLTEGERSELFRASVEVIFGQVPDFDRILRTLEELERTINGA
jgi:hypothetical protein